MAKEKCPPGKMLKGGKCVAKQKPKWLKKAIKKENLKVEKPVRKLPPGAKLGDPSTFGPEFHRVEKPKLPKFKLGKQPPMKAIPMSKRKKKKK